MSLELDVRGARKSVYSGHLNMSGTNPSGDSIDFTNYYMTFNEKPFIVISGEFHFSRYDCGFWEEELMKMKACGINTVATYMFWNHHEPVEGTFDFSGNNNIGEFVRLCGRHGLMVILRIGPYSHGECRNGGLPDWLFGRPFEVRSNDEEYLAYAGRYYEQIGRQVAGLMFADGGNIIGIQLENEYMGSCSPWEITVTQNREWTTTGRDGLEHIKALKSLAEKHGLKAVFYTGTAWGGAPILDGEMLPLWGGYAYWPWIYWDPEAGEHPPTTGYLFRNGHDENNKDFDKKYPFACCEMGGGMQVWYPYRFIAEPESVEAMCLVTMAAGCNFIGYYMFHGGRNPVINNTFTNEQLTPRISYDFQAPLGDFGQVRESYKRIKLLHYMAKDHTDLLCRSKPVIPAGQESMDPTDTATLRYASRSDGKAGFLFINNYQDHIEQTVKNDVQIEIETDEGTIRIPRNHCMTVGRNIACALPFGLDLSGFALQYSTAQYITRINDTYFFFTHEGMKGEFCFGGNCSVESSSNIEYESDDGLIIISVSDSCLSEFVMRNPMGDAIRIICMDHKSSLDFYKLNIRGMDYGIISPANVYTDGTDICLEAVGIDCFDILTYPELKFTDVSKGGIRYTGKCLSLHSYEVKAAMPKVDFQVISRYENRAVIKFDAGVLDGLTELYLKTEYIGDIGWAFINGSLIHDNLYNGTVWETGLKSFQNDLINNDLYLYVSPLASGGITVKNNSTFAEIAAAEGTACFKSFEMVPEQTIVIRAI